MTNEIKTEQHANPMSDAENWEPNDEFEEAWGQYVKILSIQKVIQGALDQGMKPLDDGNDNAAEKIIRKARNAINTLLEAKAYKDLPEPERMVFIQYAREKDEVSANQWIRATGKLPKPIDALKIAGAPEHAAAGAPEPSRIRLKKDFVQDVVDRICDYKSSDGKSIDRWNMPGGANDLLWLMEKLYPDEFADMNIKAFREHYRGVCKWPNTAFNQAGARPIYLEIFPELKRNPAPVIQIRN